MTNEEAIKASRLLAEGGLFPLVRQELERSLFDYYYDLLWREPDKRVIVPPVRRMH